MVPLPARTATDPLCLSERASWRHGRFPLLLTCPEHGASEDARNADRSKGDMSQRCRRLSTLVAASMAQDLTNRETTASTMAALLYGAGPLSSRSWHCGGMWSHFVRAALPLKRPRAWQQRTLVASRPAPNRPSSRICSRDLCAGLHLGSCRACA